MIIFAANIDIKNSKKYLQELSIIYIYYRVRKNVVLATDL